ncbi:MAG: hypothetical protein ACPF9D_09660 [Owenweeksia sp.]
MKALLFSLLSLLFLAEPSTVLPQEDADIFASRIIGYGYEGAFTRISQNDFKVFMKKSLQLKDEVQFNPLSLIPVSDGVFVIQGTFLHAGKHSSFSHLLDYDNENDEYLLTGESCTCYSANEGCEPVQKKRSMCSCSPGVKDCTKTHIVSTLEADMFKE